MTIVGPSVSDVYRQIAKDMLSYGEPVSVRGLMTHELFNVQMFVYDPRLRYVNSKVRKMDMRYLIGELCHYLDKRTDLASIAHYSKFWEKVSDDGEHVNSAYGYRLFGLIPQVSSQIQFKYAVRCLEADEASRKAVMMIYHPSDARESKDNPCTLSLQLMIRANELRMLVNMRSQDVWLGVPYDFAFFMLVQEIAYTLLKRTYPRLKLGVYVHSASSLHIYREHYKHMAELASEGDHTQIKSPALTDIDVDDWFNDLITYEKAKRGVVLYKSESRRTPFQDWCKKYLG